MGRVMSVVLFTDLVGSTELLGRLGEEGAEDLRRRHDQLLTQAVEAKNGRVVKGLGDGIMATFAGASDAVGAAVAIQQAIDRLNRSGKAPVPLGVRVGLSAGDVAFEDDDVHGGPVIEASRLCGAARGDEIVVSEIVRLLAGLADEDLVDLGRLELKGLQKPVPAWQVRWEPVAVSTIPMSALLTDVGRIFVGRDAELDRLRELWKEAAAGQRRVALLAGEPGVGKTRLAAELAEAVHAEGAIVLIGRCDEDLGVPYQPFVEALRHFVDHAEPASLTRRLGRYGGELCRLIPELRERVADLPAPLQSDAETERYRLFEAVAAWLAATSAEDPVLLVLDDLQWAAKPTLLLLRHVVRSAGVGRLMLLGTYRDTELGDAHTLLEILADLRREDGVGRTNLTGLDSSGVATFMSRAAGHDLGEDDVVLAEAIHGETEGNPFFVREVLRHLAETGALERRKGRWATRLPVDELGIPESVRDVIRRRLSRLTNDANQTLRLAAVVGPEFELSVLQSAGALTEDVLLSCLEEATTARLIVEVASARRYRFAHALVRDTLYDEVSAARRVALHHRVAEAIETAHAADLDGYLPSLAHHWARASTPEAGAAKAVDYATRAGDRALIQLANDEAVGYYQQALELLQAREMPDEGQRLDLLLSLGGAQRRAGDPAHRETLLEAARLAQSLGDTDALARAALANSRQGVMSSAASVDHERVAVLEAAIGALGGQQGAVRARLLATLALELVFAEDSGRRWRLSDEALEEARRLDDLTTLAHVLAARPYAIASPATVAERRANADELEAVARRVNDPMMHAWATFHRFRADMELGAFEEARADVEQLAHLGEDLGQPTLRWCAAWVRAAYLAAVGRLEDAERYSDLAAEIGRASGQPDTPIFVAAQRFGVCLERGRLAEIQEAVVSAFELNPTYRPVCAVAALVDAELGRIDEAHDRFENLAARDFSDIPVDAVWFFTTSMLALVATRLDDHRRSRTLYDLLYPYAHLIAGSPSVWVGCVSQYLAMLATTLGRFADAEAHFAAAEATHLRVGAPGWLARTRLEWARMLLTRRQPGDLDRARELLGQALATARQLGLAKVEHDGVALLQGCP